jgi:MFS transporter, MHS family, shikimate and dehydroshikimate transport protein
VFKPLFFPNISSTAGKQDQLARLPVVEVLRTQPRNVFITIGLRLSQIALFVLLTTYSLSYLQDSFAKATGSV